MTDTVLDTLHIGQITKEAMVNLRHQRADLPPIVEHRRDGTVVAVVHASGPAEMDGTPFPERSTSIGALGFGSDEIRLTMEMLCSPPRDGEGYVPGDLAVRHQEEHDSGVTTTLLVIAVAVRHGVAAVEAAYAPYEYAEVDGGVGVRWLDPEPEAMGEGAPGRLVQALSRALTRSPMRDLVFAVLATDDTADQGTLDHATARTITRTFKHQVIIGE